MSATGATAGLPGPRATDGCRPVALTLSPASAFMLAGMPWGLRQRVYMLLLGSVTLALSIVVLVLNQSTATEILGTIGVLGGLAMVLITLPNGWDKPHGDDDDKRRAESRSKTSRRLGE